VDTIAVLARKIAIIGQFETDAGELPGLFTQLHVPGI
jgi:hypothetical protein